MGLSRAASTVLAVLRRVAPVALPVLMLALPALSFAQTAGLPAFNTSPGPNGGT
ncbi:flagellar biosynthetic protein FliP, partial [Burkholderia sp. SIMBA_052]